MPALMVPQAAKAGKTLQETLIWKYFIQACQGLSAYHYSGILHRNIKPSNLHVTEEQAAPHWRARHDGAPQG